MIGAAKKESVPAGLAVLRVLLVLVVTLLLAQTRVWGFEVNHQHAPSVLQAATPSAVEENAALFEYDASGCVVAAKTIPNPGGRLGDAVTRQTASNVINDLNARGFTDISQEVFFQKGALGVKNRFVDIIGVNPQTGESLIINIGKQTKSGFPIMRESQALDDIIFSPTIQNYPNSRLIFIEKGASGLPPGL